MRFAQPCTKPRRQPVNKLAGLFLGSLLLAGAGVAAENEMSHPDKETVIRELGLEGHVEGGYYRRTFQADHRATIDQGEGERFTLTSIFYLLTDDAPIGHWHLNKSDIIHYYHLGSPVHYYLIYPDGRLENVVLGPDLAAGQQLQLIVRGGVWKASHLPEGSYGLISEAVSPGFEFADMTLGERELLLNEFPQHAAMINAYTR